jgi:hypothetical protein
MISSLTTHYISNLLHILSTDDYNWLDFAMSQSDKVGLFRAGVSAGYEFLETFDWSEHKELRAAEVASRCQESKTVT